MEHKEKKEQSQTQRDIDREKERNIDRETLRNVPVIRSARKNIKTHFNEEILA